MPKHHCQNDPCMEFEKNLLCQVKVALHHSCPSQTLLFDKRSSLVLPTFMVKHTLSVPVHKQFMEVLLSNIL